MKSAITCLFFLLIAFTNANAQGQKDLVGPVTETELLASDRILEIYLHRYQPDSSAIEFVQAYPDSVTIYSFVGSWCPQTKKYIPRLMKLLREGDNTLVNAQYIAVDAQKKFPKEFLKKYQIKYIPTVVVLKGRHEIGRIVEEPDMPIEDELIRILKEAKEQR